MSGATTLSPSIFLHGVNTDKFSFTRLSDVGYFPSSGLMRKLSVTFSLETCEQNDEFILSTLI
jgi:hypothetical protein